MFAFRGMGPGDKSVESRVLRRWTSPFGPGDLCPWIYPAFSATKHQPGLIQLAQCG